MPPHLRVAASRPWVYSPPARAIDAKCGNAGATKTGPKGIQNQLKNNLCATGAPTTLTFADFKSLQEQVTTLKLSGGERVERFPKDRSELSSGKLHTLDGRAIGEATRFKSSPWTRTIRT
jgi:hypothetical protein